MKYIVDAQLPKKLKNWLTEYGVDAIHTLDLPDKNDTEDIYIVELSRRDSLIVISKDSDFKQHRILGGFPEKLLIVSTGNITNKRLIEIFELNFPKVNSYFEDGNKVIEIDNTSITIHE